MLSETWWEAHATTVYVVKENFESIEEALAQLESNEQEKCDIHLQAKNFMDKMSWVRIPYYARITELHFIRISQSEQMFAGSWDFFGILCHSLFFSVSIYW